jgi:hypothetical protein
MLSLRLHNFVVQVLYGVIVLGAILSSQSAAR